MQLTYVHYTVLIQCDEPPRIAMGDVIFSPENRTLGARATYSCTQGYALNGNKNRYCQSNDQWNGTDPKCGKSYLY